MAILASSYSDDVIAIEVKKIEKSLFPSVKFPKIWQRSYSLLAFLAFNVSKKFERQGFRLDKKHKNTKNEKHYLDNPYFFRF